MSTRSIFSAAILVGAVATALSSIAMAGPLTEAEGKAAMAASQHGHLVRIGLVEGTNSYAAATDARGAA